MLMAAAGCVGNAGLEADTGRLHKQTLDGQQSREKPRDAFTGKTTRRLRLQTLDGLHEPTLDGQQSRQKPRDAFSGKTARRLRLQTLDSLHEPTLDGQQSRETEAGALGVLRVRRGGGGN